MYLKQKKIKEWLLRNKMLEFTLIIISYFILIYIIDINTTNIDYTLIGTILIGCVVLVTDYIVIKKFKIEKKIDYKKILIGIVVIGIIVRTIYILYTPITERQHDTDGNAGHIAYIEIIYETGNFPDSNYGQFYHQPLHHIIAAGWLKINSIFGVDLETSEEGIQILTAIYSCITMVITYAILKHLNIKDKYKVIVMIIVAIHPTFIILSGSINNDCLLVMFICLALLYLIKWYKNPSYKNTIMLALITAFTALTKIAGTIIAVPILYLVIDKVRKDYLAQKKNKKVIEEYAIKAFIFGTIALGLGLSFAIFRNMRLFGQSLFAVPKPVSDLYCGDNSLFTRLNVFSSEWKNIYANPYTDCNIVVYLIKSSLFGEFSVNGCNVLAIIMLMLNIVVIIVSLASLINQPRNRHALINMLDIFYITQLVVYLYENFKIQYGCTMDIRYIVPNIILGAVFIALNMNEERNLKINKILATLIVIFAIVCLIFELTYMQGLSI